jgi:hypothetical protein
MSDLPRKPQRKHPFDAQKSNHSAHLLHRNASSAVPCTASTLAAFLLAIVRFWSAGKDTRIFVVLGSANIASFQGKTAGIMKLLEASLKADAPVDGRAATEVPSLAQICEAVVIRNLPRYADVSPLSVTDLVNIILKARVERDPALVLSFEQTQPVRGADDASQLRGHFNSVTAIGFVAGIGRRRGAGQAVLETCRRYDCGLCSCSVAVDLLTVTSCCRAHVPFAEDRGALPGVKSGRGSDGAGFVVK